MADLVVDGLIIAPAVAGLLWSAKECLYLGGVKINGHADSLLKGDSLSGEDTGKILKVMKDVSGFISDGAIAFLMKEYQYMLVYVVLFSILLQFMVNTGTVVAFVLGSVTSILAGYIGMKIAVYTNVRTAHEAWKDLSSGYDVALRGGCVMGLSLVSFGVLALYLLIKVFHQGNFLGFNGDEAAIYDAIAGFGLGGSSIALFGRVGGGIYTKAADVGADLSGKNEYGMDEDDPRNPACIADNVGDNVGDIAGMGADLFGSFAEATCAALVVAASSGALENGKIKKPSEAELREIFG